MSYPLFDGNKMKADTQFRYKVVEVLIYTLSRILAVFKT